MEWREFFYFNRSDRSVILSIIVFAAVVWLLVTLFENTDEVGKIGTAVQTDSLRYHAKSKAYASREDSKPYYYNVGEVKVERFPFDPNTADSTQLLRLGLQPWQVRNIYKYRAAGGHYTRPSDFARLYGLSAKQYKELEPYIRISNDYRPAKELVAREEAYSKPEAYSKDTVRYPRKLTLHQRVAINNADTNLLKRIPGIGTYYARKIVEYRKRLGGFVDLKQLKEIDGFPESALQYMCIPDGNVRKIKVNKLTLNQLKAHPYINFYQARDIIEYRRLQGPIKNIDNLKLLPDFPSEAIERLRPYMEY